MTNTEASVGMECPRWVVRLDLDRMDDNDNHLFGVTAEIMWVPKPAYQLTLRTPLYFVRN